MKNSNKVIFNTSVLYFQLICGILIGLFTTRIVLNALGEVDYGIYMLVGGVIGMLGILNTSMANTSMRFMAHSLGSNDKEKIEKTFNTTLYLHFIIGGIIILFMELGGFFMFKYMLNIPQEKIFAAQVIFQFMIFTTFITIISVPYDAVMNAHENLLILSLVDILGYILKLIAAIILLYVKSDLLIIFGLSMLIIQLILRIIKQLYSKRKYEECKINFKNNIDKKLIKQIFSFTLWSLLGSLGSMIVTQLRGVVLNMFFGVKINAAEGIAKTASSQVNLVSISMTRAINPQLIKSEGGGDRERMLRITEVSTKYSIFLFLLFAVPVYFENNFLFYLWLGNVPEYAVLFCKLSLIAIFVEKTTFSIIDAIRAEGNIKGINLVESLILLLNVILPYIAFKNHYNAEFIYYIGIFVSFLKFIDRLYFGKKIINLNILQYIKNSIFPFVLPLLISLIPLYLFNIYINEGFLRFTIIFIVFISTFILSFWILALNVNEKDRFKNFFRLLIKKIYFKKIKK